MLPKTNTQLPPASKKALKPNKKSTQMQLESNKENMALMSGKQLQNKNIKFSPKITFENYNNVPQPTLKILEENLTQLNSNLLFKKFCDPMNQQIIDEFINKSQKKLKKFELNEEFMLNYDSILEQKMYEDEPDFSNVLGNTQIHDHLRVKMIDWMLEIFSKYPQISSNDTYFKAVSIFNLYLKKCFGATKRVLTNNDVHLCGLASMLIATKFEDELHIPLKDFYSLIGHFNFPMLEIKEKEYEIYSTLDMNVAFPTPLTFLNYYFYRVFSSEKNALTKNIYDIALFILKLCNYQANILDHKPHIFAICSLLYSIKSTFTYLKESPLNNQEIEQKMISSLMSLNENFDVKEIEGCLTKIKQLFADWNRKFTKTMNVQQEQYELSQTLDFNY